MGSHRERELLAAVDNLIEKHNEWVDDKNRPNPDADYWDAVDGLLETFDSGDIPSSCRELAEEVALFAEKVEQFEERPDQGNPYPHDAFWSARQRIEDVRHRVAKPHKKPMESIKDLCALPNMSHEQVARMWNFVDQRGTPMPWLVQKELDKPGSVVNNGKEIVGPHWRHPDATEEESQEVQDRSDALATKSRRAKRDSAPCPETPRQLWEQGVSVEQSARMLKKDEVEVRELFDAFEVERESELAGDNDQGTEGEENAADAEQKVIEMHQAGESNAAIGQTLGMHPNKVAAIVRRQQKEGQPAGA